MILIKAEGHPRVVSQHSFQGGDPKTNCSLATETSTAYWVQTQRAPGPNSRSTHLQVRRLEVRGHQRVVEVVEGGRKLFIWCTLKTHGKTNYSSTCLMQCTTLQQPNAARKTPARHISCLLTLEPILVHLLNDTGQCGHMVLWKRYTQIVSDKIVPGVQHGRGDEVQNVGSQA